MAAHEIRKIPSYPDICAKNGVQEVVMHIHFGPNGLKKMILLWWILNVAQTLVQLVSL